MPDAGQKMEFTKMPLSAKIPYLTLFQISVKLTDNQDIKPQTTFSLDKMGPLTTT